MTSCSSKKLKSKIWRWCWTGCRLLMRKWNRASDWILLISGWRGTTVPAWPALCRNQSAPRPVQPSVSERPPPPRTARRRRFRSTASRLGPRSWPRRSRRTIRRWRVGRRQSGTGGPVERENPRGEGGDGKAALLIKFRDAIARREWKARPDAAEGPEPGPSRTRPWRGARPGIAGLARWAGTIPAAARR